MGLAGFCWSHDARGDGAAVLNRGWLLEWVVWITLVECCGARQTSLPGKYFIIKSVVGPSASAREENVGFCAGSAVFGVLWAGGAERRANEVAMFMWRFRQSFQLAERSLSWSSKNALKLGISTTRDDPLRIGWACLKIPNGILSGLTLSSAKNACHEGLSSVAFKGFASGFGAVFGTKFSGVCAAVS